MDSGVEDSGQWNGGLRVDVGGLQGMMKRQHDGMIGSAYCKSFLFEGDKGVGTNCQSEVSGETIDKHCLHLRIRYIDRLHCPLRKQSGFTTVGLGRCLQPRELSFPRHSLWSRAALTASTSIFLKLKNVLDGYAHHAACNLIHVSPAERIQLCIKDIHNMESATQPVKPMGLPGTSSPALCVHTDPM